LTNCLEAVLTLVNLRYCTEEKFGGEHSERIGQAWDAVGVPAAEVPINYTPPPVVDSSSDAENMESKESSSAKTNIAVQWLTTMMVGSIVTTLCAFFV
jgi:hypothetical protein